jgi:hypothetical protein
VGPADGFQYPQSQSLAPVRFKMVSSHEPHFKTAYPEKPVILPCLQRTFNHFLAATTLTASMTIARASGGTRSETASRPSMAHSRYNKPTSD